MDIAAASMNVAQASLATSVSIGVLNMVKDQSVQQSQEMIRMMAQSVQPHLGGSIDLRG